MKKFFIRIVFIIMLISLSVTSEAGFFSKIKKFLKNNKNTSLSQDEIIKGLKQELDLSAKKAVELAGKKGGFLNNPKIRIPLPENVKKVGNFLRKIGYGNKVDEFEKSMNIAAEKAARKAYPVFKDAVKQITFKDAKKILKGGDTAITDYFKEKTWDKLEKKFKPIVEKSIKEVGVTKKYDKIVSNPFVKKLSSNKDLKLEDYVTEKSLEGLFKVLAEEEKEIRHNPAARTTDLLKKVFGSKNQK